jgi:hypothetical protein
MTESGFRQILFSLYHQPSPIPFQCREQTFPEDADSNIHLSIVDGACKIRRSPRTSPRRSTDVPADDPDSVHITIVDGSITAPASDESLNEKVDRISEHLFEAVSILYDLSVNHLTLDFVVKGETLELLPTSTCVTSSQTFMKGMNETERRFAEFFTEEESKTHDPKVCCCNEPDCVFADYKVPMTLLMLYKAEKRFPKVNPGQLYTLVLLRMPPDGEKSLPVCIRCWHLISTAEFLAHCSRRDLPRLHTLPPKVFQPLVDAELCDKRRLPVGINERMNEPHSFALSITRSPYKREPPPASPPGPRSPSALRALTAWDQQPDWVKRHLSLAPFPRGERGLSKGCPPIDLSRPKLPHFAEDPAAKKRVSDGYKKVPFDLRICDFKRKRRLHGRGEEHCDRFSFA